MKSELGVFMDSPLVSHSMEFLENGVTIRFDLGGTTFGVEKTDGEIKSTQKEPERPFLIFTATTDAIELLGSASSPKEFGNRFAEEYLKKNVDIKIMAPPGTALTYGVFSMLRRMGIRQNLIGGEVK